jgi:secreted Zn-dependent insulinase-like peptidase
MQVTNNIRKLETDPKSYRGLTLPNGIQAVLVHDSKATLSSVTVTLETGWKTNSKQYPGLSHFLENVILKGGSEKYPDPQVFHNYLKLHKGRSEVSVDPQRIQHSLQIKEQGLSQACDMLSHFLIGPTFTQEHINHALPHFKFKVPLTDPLDFFGNVDYLLNQQSANDPNINYDFILSKENASSAGFLAALH